ncbi:MAG TPA: DUF222 domain-containing protein, partial [Acidimicrobiales bacterium]|nr:DUF222 domain-containing protein [Acidimicrobiales bacterium]
NSVRVARCAELEARLRALAGQITALQAEFLASLAEYDDLRGWTEWGARSAQDWLSNHCGHGASLAKTEVTLAHAFERLPRIRAAMASGGLSMDKARALAAVASPDTEEELLHLAVEATANQLSRALAAARRALGSDEAVRLRRARQLDTWWDDDGMLVIRGRLTPEEGALFRKALQAARDSLYREHRSAGFEDDPPAAGQADDRPDPAGDADDPAAARRADALVAMAECYLANGPAGTGGDNYLVVIHVDADVLADDGDGRCHIEGGPTLSGETVRRLACGASLVWLATDERGDPVAISDKSQAIPTSLRRAVRARDHGCTFPTGAGSSCGMAPEYCDVHHVVHRAHGGPHTTTNCWGLCRFHHHLVHEGGFTMTRRDDGNLEFRRPDGTLIPDRPPPAADDGEPATPRLELDSDIAWARSNGERMDLSMTVDALLSVGLTPGPGP